MNRSPPVLLLIAVAFAGCATREPHENIPPVRWSSNDEALRILRERAAAVTNVTATGEITLARRDGQSVRLDLAMVSAQPDRLRLRAWKLGRAVFDLTLTPDGLWLFTPEDPGLRDKARAGGLDAAQLARSWRLFSGGFLQQPTLNVAHRGDTLEITSAYDPRIRCEVDARTLTPRRYVLTGDGPPTRFALRLSAYRLLNNIPYPFRYDADSESGQIRIDLRDVELNTELAAGAFVPPRRAEKLP